MIANVNATSTAWHVQRPMHFSITVEGDPAITAHFILRRGYLDRIGPALSDLGVWGQGIYAAEQ